MTDGERLARGDEGASADHLGREIRRRRKEANLSHSQLARQVGYSRQYISMAERVGKNLPSQQLVRSIDKVLNAHGALVALREKAKAEQDALRQRLTSPGQGVPDLRTHRTHYIDADVQNEAAHSPSEFLSRLDIETPVPSRVGATEVEQVRATTRALAATENLVGGGLSCDAAAGQLRWAGRLLEATPADAASRRALHEAVGNLAGVVAFSAFDIGDHASARNCFQFALWCATEGDSWALRSCTLADMSRQTVYLGHYGEALSLIEFAQVRSDRLTATARAMLHTLRARLLAIAGRHREARSEIDRADEQFAQRRPADDPPWLTYYDAAEHNGSTARALTPIALATHNADGPRTRLAAAIRLHSDGYPRSRTFSRIRLAALTMATGDPQEAAHLGRLALAEASALRSTRVLDELRALDQAAARHAGLTDVAELRADLAALTS